MVTDAEQVDAAEDDAAARGQRPRPRVRGFAAARTDSGGGGAGEAGARRVGRRSGTPLWRVRWLVGAGRRPVSRCADGSPWGRTIWRRRRRTWPGRSAFIKPKLDRYVGLLAAGRKPMGRPPVPIESLLPGAAGPTGGAGGRSRGSAASRRLGCRQAAIGGGEYDRRPVADHADAQGFLQGYNASSRVTSDHLIAAVDRQPADHRPASAGADDAPAEPPPPTCHATSGDDLAHQIGIVAGGRPATPATTNLAAPGPGTAASPWRSDETRPISRHHRAQPARHPGSVPLPARPMAHRLRHPEAPGPATSAAVPPSSPVIGNVKKILDPVRPTRPRRRGGELPPRRPGPQPEEITAPRRLTGHGRSRTRRNPAAIRHPPAPAWRFRNSQTRAHGASGTPVGPRGLLGAAGHRAFPHGGDP